MSIALTGTGGLFVRLGRMFFSVQSANRFCGTTDLSAGGIKSMGISTTDTDAQFVSALQYIRDNLYSQRDQAVQSLNSWKQFWKQLAQRTVIDQADADAVLTNKTLEEALKELISQMIGAGTIYNATNDVDASTVSATVTATSTNTGNGVAVCSVVRPDGRNNELVLAENYELICSSDSGLGATARSEPFAGKGEVAQTDKLAFDWPKGSGGTCSPSTVDCVLDASGNMLTNSDFYPFTVANTPDNFTILVGAAGTDILSEATIVYRDSTKALRIKGDGATLTSIAQTFGVSSGGTTTTLAPNTVYAVNFFARDSGAGAAAGVLELSLVDGSNVIVTDDAATDNKKQVSVATLTASYVAYNFFIRTPKVLPSTQKLRIRLSTALTSTESIYVADVAMVQATQMYQGGPWCAIFAGSTQFAKGDKFTLAVANDLAGDFQTYFERAFDMRTLGLQLPSDTGAAETIVDTLIA